MGKKHYLLTVVLAVVAGCAGGGVSRWVLPGLPVSTQPPPEQAKVIQAERFEVVDKDGKVRAMFGFEDDREPRLALYDKDGTSSATLAPFFLVISDQNDKTSAALSPLGLGVGQGKTRATWLGLFDGEPDLTLYDKQGKTRAGLGLADGEPHLGLFDENGKIRAWLMLSHGEPSLVLSDKDEKTRVVLDLSHGVPSVTLSDDKGITRAALGLFQGAPSLDLYDKDRKDRIALGLTDGEPSLELSDKQGKARATLGYVGLKDKRTGSVEKRTPSSLVLFGEDGKVIWEAP